MAVRVFLVDDHEVVRKGLVEVFRRDPKLRVVGEAGSAGEALRLMSGVSVDVAVLDVRLPDRSGIELCAELHRRFPQLAVIILSSYSDERLRAAAARAGATAYLLKQLRTQDIVTAIHRAAAKATGDEFADVAQEVIDDSPMPRNVGELTGQERHVLVLLAEGHSNREIAEQLCLAEKTVKNYVSSIMAKLNVHRRTEAAIMCVRGDLGPEFIPAKAASAGPDDRN